MAATRPGSFDRGNNKKAGEMKLTTAAYGHSRFVQRRLTTASRRRNQWPLLALVSVLLGLALPQTAFGAAPQPVINSLFADHPVMPSSFSPLKVDGKSGFRLNNFVRDIQWRSWGGKTATGSGQVSLLNDDGSTSPVTVVLGGLKRCAGVRVYTTYSLPLDAGAQQPKGWPAGQTGAFPCKIAIGAYSGRRLGPKSNCIKGLQRPSKDPELTAPWQPRPPDGFWLLCELRWKNWGQSEATGSGTIRRARHVRGRYEWRIKVKLSNPVWCPRTGSYGSGITYGALVVTIQDGQLANAGNRRSYEQRIKPSAPLCQLGYPEADIYGNPFTTLFSLP